MSQREDRMIVPKSVGWLEEVGVRMNGMRAHKCRRRAEQSIWSSGGVVPLLWIGGVRVTMNCRHGSSSGPVGLIFDLRTTGGLVITAQYRGENLDKRRLGLV